SGKHFERGRARLAERGRRLLRAAGRAARGLDEHGAADAAQLVAALGLRAPALEACPLGVLERVVEIAGGIAAVVGGAGGRLVRKGFLRDKVAPTKRDAVDAGFARRLVHEPLQ